MRERLQGLCLVATAGCIPLGEGVVFVGLAALAVGLGMQRRQVRWSVVRHAALARVLGALSMWLAAGLLALMVSREGWLKPGELGRWTPYLAVPLLLWSMTLLPRRWLVWTGTAFMASLGVAASVGLAQYLFDWHLVAVLKPQALVPGTEHAVASGFYLHRLKLAHVLLVGLLALVARQTQLPLTWRRRTGEAALLCVLLAAFAFTFTRGAFLGLGAGLAACMAAASWRWRSVLGAAALFGLMTLGASSTVRERLSSIGSVEANNVRAVIWSQSVQVIADHPLGVGLGNYTPIIGRYYDTMDALASPRTYPHNILLGAWAETGPIGLVAYAWAWVAFMAVCARPLLTRPSADPAVRAAACAGLAGAAAFWVVGMTHDVLYHNAVGFAFCGLMAFTLAFLFPGSGRASRSPASEIR